jgi:two-component system NarL family sensor kinase
MQKPGSWSISSSSILAAFLTQGLALGYAAGTYAVVLLISGVPANRHGSWWVQALTVGLVLVTVVPVRRWLQAGVDDLVFGQHDDPYGAITQIQRELNVGASATETALAQTIAHAVNLPYVEVDIPGRAPQMFGAPMTGASPIRLPLKYHGHDLGSLTAGPRRRGTGLSEADLNLLRDLAGQVAVWAYATRAAQEAQSSREQVVRAREEERRRLRRDLHDGLGPTLAALNMQLSAVQRLLPEQAAAAAELVEGLRGDLRATTGQIRRLVYDLRPPLLDELGLIGAIRSLTSLWSTPTVQIDATGLPGLPAAVEVALFRIATEALQNVLKHAAADNARVGIRVTEDRVELEIVDDGRGLPEPLLRGVGLLAMHERAEELGGALTVSPATARGTQVKASLPLQQRRIKNLSAAPERIEGI